MEKAGVSIEKNIDIDDDVEYKHNCSSENNNGASLYENNADKGSFSDLLELMSEDKPSNGKHEKSSSGGGQQSGSKNGRSRTGSWKEFVRAKKWKGTVKGRELMRLPSKKKERGILKKKRKKQLGWKEEGTRKKHAASDELDTKKAEKDGEYFHIFLLEYFWRLCKFDKDRFRETIMRLFNSGIFDLSFQRLQSLVSNRDAVSVGLHELMAGLIEEFKHFAQPRYPPLLMNHPHSRGPFGFFVSAPVYASPIRAVPHKRCFSSAAIELRSKSGNSKTSFLSPKRVPSPPLLGGGSSLGWMHDSDVPVIFQPISRYSEEFIEIPGTLGKGGFGSVYRAQRHLDGVVYAIKKIHFRVSSRSTRAFETVIREVRALACLDHPNVCRYYNAWIEPIQESDLLLQYKNSEGSHGEWESEAMSEEDEEDEGSDSSLSLDATTDVPSELLRSTSEEDKLATKRQARIWSLDGSVSKNCSNNKSEQELEEPQEEEEQTEEGKGKGKDESTWGLNVSEKHSTRSDINNVNWLDESNDNDFGTADGSFNGIHSGEDEVIWASTKSFDDMGDKKDFGSEVDCTVDGLDEEEEEEEEEGDEEHVKKKKNKKEKKEKKKEKKRKKERESKSSSRKKRSTSSNKGKQLVPFSKPKATHTLFIQMQCYEEDTLKNFLAQENRVVDKKENLRIFRQIVEALKHIHEKGIYHRDLKPANIFLHQKVVKLGDFGLAKEIQQNVENEENHVESLDVKDESNEDGECHTGGLGTMSYAAPEQKLAHGKYTNKVDIYPLGIILFELYCPFATQMERMLILSKIQNGILPPDMLKHYPEESAMVLRMTSNNPDDRPSASEILESSLFKEDQQEQMVEHLQAELKKKDHLIEKQKQQISQQAKQLKRQEKQIRRLMAQLAALQLENHSD